ncbi:hypothetical protein [Brevibacillus laterosporus]|uniref:hypothetical protein n=1 Tax=Brevibacillus laterosporus TaxID=1465 RepID=UPI0014447FB4|nr:hypothetical protein [Brevibacillus laterosporus]NKQ18444.1 hypothetical protein [Brevibacillus laterosporus]WNX33212.1 hypothetical protein RWW94_10630 [Brevibacillus laterosporus]
MAKLPDTASISDIIKALTEVEAINQKADLVSVVGSPASNSLPVSDAVSKLLDAKTKLVSNLKAQGVNANVTESMIALANKIIDMPNRRWAAGTIQDDGRLEVSGLAFMPSFALCVRQNAGSGESFFVNMVRDQKYAYQDSYAHFYTFGNERSYLYVDIESRYKTGLTNDGFSIKSPRRSLDTLNWIAFE